MRSLYPIADQVSDRAPGCRRKTSFRALLLILVHETYDILGDKTPSEALSPALHAVLACSGCCNRIPQTGYLRNTMRLLVIVLEAGGRGHSTWDGVSGEGLLPQGSLPSDYNLTWQRGKRLSGVSFRRAFIPRTGLYPHNIIMSLIHHLRS